MSIFCLLSFSLISSGDELRHDARRRFDLFAGFLVVLLGAFSADFILGKGGQKVAVISTLLASAIHF
jgi:hypothetical protein